MKSKRRRAEAESKALKKAARWAEIEAERKEAARIAAEQRAAKHRARNLKATQD